MDETTKPQAQPRSDRLYEVVDPKSQFCGGIYKHRTSDSDVEYVRKDPPSAALQAQPPERIWIDVNAPQFPGYYFLKPISGISTTEYVRAGLPRAAADDEWLPITDAPKGRKLIVGYLNPLGNWRSVMGCYYLDGTLESETDESGFAEEGWYEETEAYDYLMPMDQEPTHFRFLPAAPVKSRAEREGESN